MSDEKKDDLVKIPSFAYQNIYGALGIQTSKSAIDWERCRDRFQNKSEAISSFLFYHKDNTGDNVIKFMRTFEAACGVPDGQELTIKKTTNKNVLWIGLTDWWKYRVRRSLLTALLRCGQNFINDTGEGFLTALYSEYYLSGTKEAVEWFMTGHTAVKMKKNLSFPGWHNYFAHKQKSQIEGCLVKLKRKRGDEPVPGEFQMIDLPAEKKET